MVIGIPGIKLVLSVPRHFLDKTHEFHAYLAAKSPALSAADDAIHGFLASHYFDLGTSVLTLLIFIVPVVWHRKSGKPA